MNKLNVYIEIQGKQIRVGNISFSNERGGNFCYVLEYLDSRDAAPISISLPLQKEPFSAIKTKNFFEGLLPEGFTRQSVARWMHVDETDYLSILAGLGNECLGAIRIVSENESLQKPFYEKLTSEQVAKLAKEGATRSTQLVTKAHLSLTGASGKVGLYYDEQNDTWFLPKGEAPSTHIVKQSHIRLDGIVTNEQLCLQTARHLGIDVPESFIINMGNAQEEQVLFASRRYDRLLDSSTDMIQGLRRPLRLHQEDFAQAMGMASSEKYEKNNQEYLRKIFHLLSTYSASPIEDQMKLWDIMVFDYLIGNTDNHIKNISLLYDKNLKGIHLAPAYDIISTAIYESSTRNMGIAIAGEICLDDINEEVFRKAASEIDLGEKMLMNRFYAMKQRFASALEKSIHMLTAKGFDKAESIGREIMKQGGIANK
ncbi:MAG: HipA domain-containing protein [Hespellia sp.]|nr:HipA domain-containing protein [Hespellia sp.]